MSFSTVYRGVSVTDSDTPDFDGLLAFDPTYRIDFTNSFSFDGAGTTSFVLSFFGDTGVVSDRAALENGGDEAAFLFGLSPTISTDGVFVSTRGHGHFVTVTPPSQLLDGAPGTRGPQVGALPVYWGMSVSTASSSRSDGHVRCIPLDSWSDPGGRA